MESELTTFTKTFGLHCELCIRYGVKTPVDGEVLREIEGEGVSKKYLFPVCQCCANELDSDTRVEESTNEGQADL